jgi:hypothetical protein
VRETLILLAAILAVPLAVLAIRALVGWRYQRMLRWTTGGEGALSPDPASELRDISSFGARPPLAIVDLTASPADVTSRAAALIAEAHARTSRFRLAFVLALIAYSAIVSATVFASFIPQALTDGRIVALYLLQAPFLIVLASVLSLPIRAVAFLAAAYVGLAIALFPFVATAERAWFLVSGEFALFLLIPAGVALLAARWLRPVIAFGGAIALFLMIAFAIAALMATLQLGPSFDEVRPEAWGLGVITLLSSIVVVAWMLNRPSLTRPLIGLFAITAAAAALCWLWPAAIPVAAMIVGIGTNALQLLFIWLLFRTALRMQQLRWLPWQALQAHLALALLSLYLVALLLIGAGLFSRQMWSALAVVAAFVVYVVTAHVLLHRALRHQRAWPPKRLLFLRAFGSRFRSRRLLNVLDDTWRRIGRIDLIGGVDLGIDTVDSRMLHAFLIRRPDRLVVDSSDDEVAALRELRTAFEGDGRYPINDLVCASGSWQPVVTQLATGADVVLMDMRGFTRQHHGCIFELTELIAHVPLTRLVIVIDGSTDRQALVDVAQAARQQLPEGSVNADERAALRLLTVIGRRAELRLFERLAAAAS